MAMADANIRSWKRESEIWNLRTDNKNLGFMQVRKETLRVAPLWVDLGDLPASELKARMKLTLYFNFPAKQESTT